MLTSIDVYFIFDSARLGLFSSANILQYNTRLLIPKETGMFATVAVVSNGRQKDDTKEHVHRESPLTNCVLFPKYVFDCLHVVSFLACVAGVRNLKNL